MRGSAGSIYNNIVREAEGKDGLVISREVALTSSLFERAHIDAQHFLDK